METSKTPQAVGGKAVGTVDNVGKDFLEEVERIIRISYIAKTSTPRTGLKLMKEIDGSSSCSPIETHENHECSLLPQSDKIMNSKTSSANFTPGPIPSVEVGPPSISHEDFFNLKRKTIPNPNPAHRFRVPSCWAQGLNRSQPAAASISHNTNHQNNNPPVGEFWLKKYFFEKKQRTKIMENAEKKSKNFKKQKRKATQFTFNISSSPNSSPNKYRRKPLSEQLLDSLTSPIYLIPPIKKSKNAQGSSSSNSGGSSTASGNSIGSSSTSTNSDNLSPASLDGFPALTDKGWTEMAKIENPKFFSIFNRNNVNKENDTGIPQTLQQLYK